MFFMVHVRHINLSKEHPERIKKTDKKTAEELDYDGIEFPLQEKDFNKIEVKMYALMCLAMKMCWFFQFMFQMKNLKTQWICYF